MAGPERVLVDTGFFIALFNERDGHHESALKMAEWLDVMSIILPWPILYETLNTRFVRRPERLERFDAIVHSPETELLDDCPYRVESLKNVLAMREGRNSLSLVDFVLCQIIEDVNVSISAMLTFNERDFQTVCQLHNVELLPSTGFKEPS